jgi:L-ascorbate metabolism protein UlaG (beta-lactamase superfamily)
MKVTKIAHSCLLVEENGVRILTDPTNFSKKQNELDGIDILLITHEHADHCDPESVKAIIKRNPNAKVITNSAVGAVLNTLGIKHFLLENGGSITESGIKFEGFGEKHALVYSGIPIVQNTGYMIAGKLFHPGDSLTIPSKHVEVLALPFAGPWLKLAESVDYVKIVKPKRSFPIHDASLKSTAFLYGMTAGLLKQAGHEFVPMEEGAATEF